MKTGALKERLMTTEYSATAVAPDTQDQPSGPPPRGVDAIRHALQTMPLSPGVYRMLGQKGEVLYVGKALSLRTRAPSSAPAARPP